MVQAEETAKSGPEGSTVCDHVCVNAHIHRHMCVVCMYICTKPCVLCAHVCYA